MPGIRVNPDTEVALFAGEGIVVRFNDLEFTYDDPLCATLLAHIDSSTDEDDLADTLSSIHVDRSLSEIYYVIERLKKTGVVSEERSTDGTIFGISRSPTSHQLTRSDVHLWNWSGSQGSEESFRASLSAAQLTDSPDSSLKIVLVRDYLDRALDTRIDQENREGNLVLLVQLDGAVPTLGPTIVADADSRCFSCLQEGLRAIRTLTTPGRTGGARRPFSESASHPLVAHTAAKIFAIEIAKSLVLDSLCSSFREHMVSYGARDGRIDYNYVDASIRCPRCVHGNRAAFADTRTEPGLSGHFTENGSRTMSPEETYGIVKRYVSPVCGIIRNVSATLGHGGIHAYSAGQNVGLRHGSLREYKRSSRSFAGGKGKTAIQAKVSAICEGLERHCGMYRGYERTEVASFSALGDAAIDPRELTLYSAQQYTGRNAARSGGAHRNAIPEPFRPDQRLSWSPVTSMSTGQERLLPTSLCYFGFSDNRSFFANSNGCAAGNSMDEAVLGSMMELVERDCVAIWWYNRIRRPAVDLRSLDDPFYSLVATYYKNIGREFWVLDLTHDLQIPCFVSVSRAVAGADRMTFGFGAHLDPLIAVSRAVTEMNQFLPNVLSFDARGSRAVEALSPQERWFETASLDSETYLAPDGIAPIETGFHKERGVSSLQDAISYCVSILHGKGLEAFSLDQTRSGVDLSVVRTFVPRMRHFWACFAPGRLFDVPVEIGWQNEKTPEANLNPIPMFL